MNKILIPFTLILSSLTAMANDRPFDVSISASETALAQHLQIKDKAGNHLVDTEKALPRIENAYSPHSYDGFQLEVVAGQQGSIVVTDLQGEHYTMMQSKAVAGDYLLLKTQQEGNASYNFNLYFRHDSHSGHLN